MGRLFLELIRKMAQSHDSAFEVDTLVWTEEDGVWYPARVVSTQPIVVQWAATASRRWPDSEVEQQSVRQWDQWATIEVTAAIRKADYEAWRTHAAFSDVLATGGRGTRRAAAASPSPATGSSPSAPDSFLRSDKWEQVNRTEKATQRKRKLPSASNKVSDPPAPLCS